MKYRYEPSDDTVTFIQGDNEVTFDYDDVVDIIESIRIIREGNEKIEIPDFKESVELLNKDWYTVS